LIERKVRRSAWAFMCLVGVVLGCRAKPPQEQPGLRPQEIRPEDLPPNIRRDLEDTARRQSGAMQAASAVVHRAYHYKGYSWHEPSSLGKLVAVDAEFSGYTSNFDLDDIDLVDGSTGANYGSNPQVALLDPSGQLAKDENKDWPPAPKPLRLLLIYAAPRSLTSVRLSYWGQDLTSAATRLGGTGPLLAPPKRSRQNP
jgi:hypothetical protein